MSGITFYESGERKEDSGVPVPENPRRQGQPQMGSGGGIPGPPGPTGPRGPMGLPGEPGVGIQGPIGVQGPRGLRGETGLPGADGTIVEANPRGTSGDDLTRIKIGINNFNIKDPNATNVFPNPTGDDGATITRLSIDNVNFNLAAGSGGSGGGGTGPVGPVGPQGPEGPAGPQGQQGPPGPAGSPGADGQRGPAGMDGADGQDGAQGPQGIQGPAGAAGADGRDGRDGSDASVTARNVIATVSGTAGSGKVPTYTNSNTWTWADAPSGGGGGSSTQTIIREVVETGRITQKLGSVEIDVASPTTLVDTGLSIPTVPMMALNVGKDISSGFDDADLYVFLSSKLKELNPTTAGATITVSTAVVLYAAARRTYFIGRTAANNILISSNAAATDLLPLTLYAFNEVLDEDNSVEADVDITAGDTFKSTGISIPNAAVLALNPGKKGNTSYLDVNLRLILREALLALPAASNGDTSLPTNSLNIFTGRSDSYYIGRTSTNEILLAASGASVDLIPFTVYPFDIRLISTGVQMINILEHTVFLATEIDIPDTRLMAVNFGRRTNSSIPDGDIHLIETADIRRLNAASAGQTVSQTTGEMVIHSTSNQFFLGRTNNNKLLITCLTMGNLSMPFTVYSVNDLRGPPGMDGMDGADGADGAPGRDGRDGTNGRDGARGPQGIQGIQGIPGRNGMDGVDGIDGTDGKDGKDAVSGSSDVEFIRELNTTPTRDENLEFDLTKSLVANGPWKGEIVREGSNLYYYFLTANGTNVLVWNMKTKARVTSREIALGSDTFYRDICSDNNYLYASYISGSDLAVRVWQISDKSRVSSRDFTLSALKHNASQYSIATDGRFILAVGEIASVAAGVRFYSFDFEGNRTDDIQHASPALTHTIVSTSVEGNAFVALYADNGTYYSSEFNTSNAVPVGSAFNLDDVQEGDWSSVSINYGILYPYNANALIHKLFAFKFEEIIGIEVNGEGVEFPTGSSTPVDPTIPPPYKETRLTIVSNEISGAAPPEGATHINFTLSHQGTSNGKWFLSLPISAFRNQTNRVPQTYFSDSENPRQTSINDADVVAITVTLDRDLNRYSFAGSNSNVRILEAFWNNLGGKQGDKGETGEPGMDGTNGMDGSPGRDGTNGRDGNDGATGPRGPAGQSITGPQGPRGIQGQRGESGTNGQTGPAGPAGPQGPRGFTGQPGNQGRQGETGNTGPRGPTGPQGPTGQTGPRGPTGAQGRPGTDGSDASVTATNVIATVSGTPTSGQVATYTSGNTWTWADASSGGGLTLDTIITLGGTLYMVGGNNVLYSLDSSDGSATRIGSSTQFGVSENSAEGLAYHNGVVYMIGNNNNALFTLNITTGAATRVGSSNSFGVGETRPGGLASHNGNLYMVGQENDGRLYTLNTTTGAATRVGTLTNFGVGESSPSALVSHNNILYMVGLRSDVLFSLNTTTGRATRVGSSTQFGVRESSPFGLASLDGNLYMVGGGNDALFILDLNNGSATRVGSSIQFGVSERFPLGMTSVPRTLTVRQALAEGGGGSSGGGIQGPPGPTGSQGPQGARGPIGPRGPQGQQGPAGQQGPQGQQGPAGSAPLTRVSNEAAYNRISNKRSTTIYWWPN